MINKLLALASKYVPVGLGIKGIGKIDPRLEKFFTAAALAGYGADEAMGFVRDRLEGKTVANADEQDRLDQGSSQGTLRPDEGAARIWQAWRAHDRARTHPRCRQHCRRKPATGRARGARSRRQ